MKGPKSSLKRWFAWLHSHHFWSSEWTTKLLHIIWVSIRKGWAKSWEDIWRGALPLAAATTLAITDGAAEHKQPADAQAQGSSQAKGAAVGSSTDGASRPASTRRAAKGGSGAASSTSKAADKQAAQEVVQGFRSRSANSLHAVARLLGDRDLKHQCNMVALAAGLVAATHHHIVERLASPEETAKVDVEWSHWEWLEEVKQMLETASDFCSLEKCGFSVDYRGRDSTPSAATARW